MVLVLLAFVYLGLRGSLPALDGELVAAGLGHPVSITRDALGIPTIEAADRIDLAYATGFAHAQDRFFQMDLSRRFAAGELSALFGDVAADQDARARVFGFRKVARRVLEQATPSQRAVLEAYAHGVNAGLASLDSRPFEYWVLRVTPLEWRPEDTILVVHSMWWDLQYSGLRRERLRRQIDARLAGAVTATGWKRASCFLSPPQSSWDAPNESAIPQSSPREPADCETIPSSQELNVRGSAPKGAAVQEWVASETGSNNWALAGSLTASGGALVASDMHLGLRVPGVWYRARLKTAGLDLNGLTLPGAPVLVAGSNGFIAWTFSNSYGDWMDVNSRPCDAPGAGLRFEGPDEHGTCWFASWLATVPEATNLALIELERIHTAAEAVRRAPQMGIPHQNLIVGDRAGHIAWTIIGRIPLGTGVMRNEGTSGWRSAAEQPAIVDPQAGRLWAANTLSTDDAAQQRIIGDDETMLGADYDLGARARQIRDDLRALPARASEADMLVTQLDDRAVFLARWRELLLKELDEDALREEPRRAELRRWIEAWEGRAAVPSIAYRLVREYRDHVETAVWQSILGSLDLTQSGSPPPSRFEQPLWTLVTQRPMHMLSAAYPDWRQFLLAMADDTMADAERSCGELSLCAWGRHEPVRVRHPLSPALSFAAPWLDMQTLELPGDRDMPRVQAGAFGASERFAVTPGREQQGYLHIAGGQSGHPLSPYYRAGFAEWAQGKPLPFLPGAARHRLRLTPR